MNTREIFTEQEIPFAQLEGLGITREAYRALPRAVSVPLEHGCVTPIIQARVDTSRGYHYQIPLKLQITRDRHGRVLLLAYPLRKEIDNSLKLTRAEVERAKAGGVIRKDLVDDYGVRRAKYLQLDPETRSFMMRDVAAVQLDPRLQDLEKVRDIELGQNQKDAVREGKPVELTVGDEKVTVGLDLREPSCFKVVSGDMDEWRRQQKIRYDDAHPEYKGYVQTDKNRWEYEQLIIKQREQGLSRQELEREQKKRTGLIR